MSAGERDINLIFRTLRNTGRVLKNAVSQEVIALERRPGGVEFKEIQHLVAGSRGRTALQSGEIDNGLVWASQVIGLINDVPTCAELIERMVADCRTALARGRTMFV